MALWILLLWSSFQCIRKSPEKGFFYYLFLILAVAASSWFSSSVSAVLMSWFVAARIERSSDCLRCVNAISITCFGRSMRVAIFFLQCERVTK